MNNVPRYLIDDILQVFDAHGNMHIVLGAVSGQELPDGSDVNEPVVTIVLPLSRVHHLSNQLILLSQSMSDGRVKAEESQLIPTSVEVIKEKIGRPIFMKF